MLMRVRAAEGDVLDRLRLLRREPQRMLKTAAFAEHRVFGDQLVVDRRRAQRPARWQFFVGKADTETARIILAHFGVGVRKRRPVAETRYVHAPDIMAGIALDHPIGERQTDAAALAEAGHHAASDPEVSEAPDRPNERIAVRRESEGAIDDLADADLAEFGEMFERGLEARRDAVEIVGQQVLPEIPWRLPFRPRLASLLVGADQHAAAFLAHI